MASVEMTSQVTDQQPSHEADAAPSKTQSQRDDVAKASAADVDGKDAATEANHPSALSKNQQKKLKRRQQWEDERPARKAQRKEKRIEQRERKREKVRSGELPAHALRKQKIESEQVPITVLIDCQFEEQMTPEELISMGGQLTRCYSDHRRAAYKTHLAISSFGGQLQERFEGLLNNQHKSWDVRFRSQHFAEVAEEAKTWIVGAEGGRMPGTSADEPAEGESTDHDRKDDDASEGEIVYLTSDSPDTLHTLKPRSTYIIGGIVDKNRHKGICYQRARDHKIKTAKLPIGEFMQLSSRHVLTTNHVHEIMLKWLEYRDWGKAFMAVIPQRKGGTLRTADEFHAKVTSTSAKQEDHVTVGDDEGDEDDGEQIAQEVAEHVAEEVAQDVTEAVAFDVGEDVAKSMVKDAEKDVEKDAAEVAKRDADHP